MPRPPRSPIATPMWRGCGLSGSCTATTNSWSTPSIWSWDLPPPPRGPAGTPRPIPASAHPAPAGTLAMGGAGAGSRETPRLLAGDSPYAQAAGDEELVLRAARQPWRRNRRRRRLRQPVRPPDGAPVDPAVGDDARHTVRNARQDLG